MNFDHTTKQIELELQNTSQGKGHFSSDACNLSHMLKWCLKLIYQDVKDLFCFFKTGMENVSESSAPSKKCRVVDHTVVWLL